MSLFDSYGCEIAWEQCDHPECDRGMVLDERENVLDCPKCRGTGGFFQGVAMSRERYDSLQRREDADHFATYYPDMQETA